MQSHSCLDRRRLDARSCTGREEQNRKGESYFWERKRVEPSGRLDPQERSATQDSGLRSARGEEKQARLVLFCGVRLGDQDPISAEARAR